MLKNFYFPGELFWNQSQESFIPTNKTFVRPVTRSWDCQYGPHICGSYIWPTYVWPILTIPRPCCWPNEDAIKLSWHWFQKRYSFRNVLLCVTYVGQIYGLHIWATYMFYICGSHIWVKYMGQIYGSYIDHIWVIYGSHCELSWCLDKTYIYIISKMQIKCAFTLPLARQS